MKKFLKILLGVIFALCFVLAVACGNTDDGTLNEDELLYKPSQTVTTVNTYNGITLDGVLDDSEWGSVNPYECHNDLGGFDSDYKMWATVCDEGVLLAFSWRGPKAYRNPSLAPSNSSCVELYVASGDVTQIKDNAWQIELLPNGVYQTTKSTNGGNYTQYNASIEYAAKVHGQINVDNDGFDGEAMIPWSMLGGKSDTVSIDAALIVQEDFNKQRLGWWSITDMNESGYSWTNPQGWLRYTEYGWFDKADPVVYKINDGETLEHATVEMKGSYNEGSFLTITPDEGYILKSLKINGEEYNTLIVSMPTGTVYANIEVEVEETDLTKHEIPVIGGYAYTGKAALKDTAITLVDEDGNYYAGTTDKYGALTVYAPDGNYTLQIPGYAEEKVTIEYGAFQGLIDGKLTLTKSGILVDYTEDSIKEYITITQTEKGDSFVFTGTQLDPAKNRFIFGSGVDYTNAVFTFTVGDTHGKWLDLRVDTIRNKNTLVKSKEHSSNVGEYAQFDFWTNNGKSNYQVGAGENKTASDTTSASYMIAFSTENKITTAKFFVKSGKSYEYIGYFKCDQVTDLFIGGTGGPWDACSITEFKIYSGDETMSMIEFDDESSSQVEVDAVNKAFIGDRVQVTVTPKAAASEDKEVAIKEIYLNGNAVKYNLNYDGSAELSFLVDELGKAYSLKIVTEETAKTSEITFTAVHKYDNETEYYALENAQFAFKSDAVTKYGVCVKGSSYKVKLADGTYTVSVEGHDPYTLTVENSGTDAQELKLTRSYVWLRLAEGANDKVSLTKGTDGSYSVETTGALTTENLIVLGSGIDYTNTLVTFDVDWLRPLWQGGVDLWLDFRMNSDESYTNEKNQSASIYAPTGSKNVSGSGVGGYYMFSIHTNSYTCRYTVGAGGEQRYFEWDAVTRPNTATTSASYAMTFKTASDKTTVSLYIKVADGTYAKLGEISGAKVKDFFLLGAGGGWGYPVKINDIKFYENASKVGTVAVGDESSEYVGVTFDKEKLGLGETLTITVVPKEIADKTVTVMAVKVNNRTLTMQSNDDGTITAMFTSNVLADKLEVVVEAIAKGIPHDLTFTATHKFVGNTDASALTDAKITFVMGAEETVAEYEDGTYKVALANGAYTVKVRGYNDITVEIENGKMNVSELVFEREKVFVELTNDAKDKVSLTKAEDGSYSIKTTGALTTANLIVLGNGLDYTNTLVTFDVDWLRPLWQGGVDLWVDFRMNSDDEYGNEKNASSAIYAPAGTKNVSGSGVGSYYMFGVHTNSYTCRYTVGAGGEQRYFEWGAVTRPNTATTSASYAMTFKTASDKTTVTLYIKVADGTYAKLGEISGAKVKDFFLLGAGGGWNNPVEINNIKFYENASKVGTVAVGDESSEYADVTFDKETLALDDTTTITATPKTIKSKEVTVTGIKVNGNYLTLNAGENGVVTATYKCNVLDDNITIVVEATAKGIVHNLTFTAQHKSVGSTEVSPLTGETITFVMGAEETVAEYEDGSYKISLADGVYTLKVLKHNSITVEIEDGVMNVSPLVFEQEKVLVELTADAKDKVSLTRGDDYSYSIKTTGALTTENLIVLGNGVDFTDTLVTFDINWLRVWGEGGAYQWLDFRMNTDEAYTNEMNQSSSIYAPAGSGTLNGSGVGPYYLFTIGTNSYTCIYSVGADGEKKYFEWDSVLVGSWQKTAVHSSYAFKFKTTGDKTTVTLYIKFVDGTYAKIAEMTGGKVKDFFLLGAGGGWDNPVEINNIKFYENDSKTISVSSTSSSDVTVSLSQDKLGLGENVNITVTPKQVDNATVTVSAITMNGTAIPFTVTDEGVATATFAANTYSDKYEIGVETILGVAHEVTFTAKHKYPSETSSYAMENETITFVLGSKEVVAEYKDGVYTALLFDGEHIVKVARHDDLTVTVENGEIAFNCIEFTRSTVWMSIADSDKNNVTLTNDNGVYSVKTTGAMTIGSLITLGSGLDYTDLLVTLDVDWLVARWSEKVNLWLDFRMNSDDVYNNEMSDSAAIYAATGSLKTGAATGTGPYYIFDIYTNSSTCQYKVGADGEQRYFEWDKLTRPNTATTSASYAFTFKTVGDKTTVALYIILADGTYGKLGEMTGAKVKDFFLLGAGGGWGYPVEINNIKFYENASKTVSVSDTSSSDVTVAFSAAKVALGESVTITATPNNAGAVTVTAVKVNGTDVEFTTAEDGTVTATFTASVLADKYEVEVSTSAATSENSEE